jgi:hypothetical protein
MKARTTWKMIAVLAAFAAPATLAWAGGGNVKPDLKTDELAR